jgi:hypothetical protein
MLDYSIPTNGAALSLNQSSSKLRMIITHKKADIDRLIRILGKQPLEHLKALDPRAGNVAGVVGAIGDCDE